MVSRPSAVLLTVLLLAAAFACNKSNPAQPTGITPVTASIAAPRPLQPATGTLIKAADQPVTLVVQNAVVTQPGSTTYTFELATDAAFAAKVVQTRDGVAEASGGQTSVTLDPLAAAKDYYWHARAQAGGTTGVFGPTYKFTIGPAVTIQAPVPLAPLSGSTTGTRPTFTVTNATTSGPAGAITYRFEVAASAAFSQLALTRTVIEGASQTSFAAYADLVANQTYYWRATAIDSANGVSSAASTVQSFTTYNTRQSILAGQLGVSLWPGVQPPGTTGRSALGDNWQVQTLVSFGGVRFTSPPLEALQIFDLMDRGFSPQAAIDWRNANGYPRAGAYYAVGLGVIGIDYMYMALNRNGAWDLILRSE